MNAYTPGPWSIYTPRPTADHWSMREVVGADQHSICTLRPNGKNEQRGEDNLRLIAAAPDLLQALQDLLKEMRERHPKMSPRKDFSLLLASAQASKAIHKATNT